MERGSEQSIYVEKHPSGSVEIIRGAPKAWMCIHYGGRQFRTSAELAGVFIRHAEHLLGKENGELVPLLHEGGIELVYISAQTPLSLHDARYAPADGSHTSDAENATMTDRRRGITDAW
jgi:hypothetical protein